MSQKVRFSMKEIKIVSRYLLFSFLGGGITSLLNYIAMEPLCSSMSTPLLLHVHRRKV